MHPHITRAIATLLIACLLLPSVVGTVGAAQSAAAPGAAQSLTEHSGAEVLYQEGTPEGNATVPNGSDTAPSSAERVRITPLRFSEEWLSTEVAEPDTRFNTSGPFVMFSITEPVDAVRISQQGADAELLTGGQTVRVSYAKDAAPDSQSASLYTLEIYYQDGSTGEVELYASQTDVSVDAASLEDYKGFLYELRGDASDAGYEKNPEGVEAYYENTKERADLLDSLFVEQATQAVATVLAWLLNPVAIAITLALVALGSYYRISRRGYALEIIGEDSGKAQRLRERLRLAYRENQQTADEERLQDLPKVGSISEIYWRDGQGVSTVYQLAELARTGKTVRVDGELVKEHHGLSELEAGSLEGSWLETVAGSGRQRIASYDVALSHCKTALERMMSTYGMGHIYRDTYEEVVQLIDERQQLVREGATSTTSGAGIGGSASPGGD